MPGPATMTFSTLSADILAYSERPNDATLQAQIPRLVMVAETEIAADLKILGTELPLDGVFTAGDPVLEKPQYWRKTNSFRYTVPGEGSREIYKRTYEFLKTFWPDEAATGAPRYYAEYGPGHFIVAPTPSAAFAFEIVFSVRVEPLSDDTQTNWITENAPQLLLYNCMKHASLWLKNDAKASTWEARYEAAKASLRMENLSRKMDRSTVDGE